MYKRCALGRSGMTETGKFFSPRNGIALVELWKAIHAVEDEAIRQELRFAFTAILPRASMRYQWSAKRPLNAQNQTYYVAPVYFEWNVFDLYSRKVNAVIRANEALFDHGDLFSPEKLHDVRYELASAEKLMHLDDQSVDYVFTDPPFGSNIFYSDMNLFHEAWLGETTDHACEAVVHTQGKRKNGSEKRYEELLRGAFSEAFRVLKPGRYMSVVFGNSSGRIWGLVQRALRDAGFKASPVHVAILDKGQRSVKGLNSGSEGVVTVDLIVTVQKPAEDFGTDRSVILANGDYKCADPCSYRRGAGRRSEQPEPCLCADFAESHPERAGAGRSASGRRADCIAKRRVRRRPEDRASMLQHCRRDRPLNGGIGGDKPYRPRASVFLYGNDVRGIDALRAAPGIFE